MNFFKNLVSRTSSNSPTAFGVTLGDRCLAHCHNHAASPRNQTAYAIKAGAAITSLLKRGCLKSHEFAPNKKKAKSRPVRYAEDWPFRRL